MKFYRIGLTAIAAAIVGFSTGVSRESEITLLSGSGSDDTVDWEFKVNGGRNSGEWSTIPVPSNWEMQGYGTYHYWKDWGEEREAPDSLGQYRYRFDVPAEWKGQSVDIVFGGAMTDTEVRVNGKPAGPAHQGGFYQFRYEISSLLEYGDSNLLEVDVRKFSSNESVNLAEREADYWLFGGIYRPVWLETRPVRHIERIAVDARHDGGFSVDVFVDGVESPATARATIKDLDGRVLGRSKTVSISQGQEETQLVGTARGVKPWSAEWPNLYRLEVELKGKGKLLHSVVETIGFRTLELRAEDGFYVNGRKVVLKGSNRHTFWPDTGRTTNATLSENDVLLMKEMNMNAVRMSHYPPDPHFLEACDRLGLYVLDELGGWQKSYDSEVGAKLVRETVTRDVNHPSIVFWANGNEGGWNTDLDDDYALYDPQSRTVLHPWNNFNGVNTSHYENYNSGTNWLFNGSDLIMPTEFLHGLYDGGHGAGLDDWWKLIQGHPLGLGGFLWAFADEGIVRDDQDGRIDVEGNRAPDGIVGPYREKEGSFYTIKEIWAPICLPRAELDTLPASFDGTLRIENRYSFTNVDQLRFEWRLVRFEGSTIDELSRTVTESGMARSPAIAPSLVGDLKLDLPVGWAANDAVELAVFDPSDREIYTWSWMIRNPDTLAKDLVGYGEGEAEASETAAAITLSGGDVEIVIDKETGRLVSARNGDVVSPLNNGPIVLAEQGELSEINIVDGVVRVSYDGALRSLSWELLPSGWLKMDYEYYYRYEVPYDYFGVSFDFDESDVEGVRWLGKGPYRVWKNRRKGVEFGVWEKEYNDTVTGDQWVYPEFKGFHDDVYAAKLQSEVSPLSIVIASPDINLRLFTPTESAEPRDTHVEFPEGDLSFLHGIAAIGTKFKTADKHGPASQKNWPHRGGQSFSGTVYFKFGE
ncbi:Glycosyl hydrolases family 2, immunoglobulin-like beta-sandwich domain [Verrucomicrobiia bacterium DG1235]|nr:Glycosyl hydrolases family 2, immunoglobulin-like beta-sandwich domain [Verrucomicrobiae bacterium DG1235]